ncbi:iron complex outermembrane recepter protein [Desulfobacula phenolica]|uniref:Iron complex outermembrane recepter protein n=2 Tax=Desulfobacula phenolica TaxID=90732 RepID=A0A1H2GMX8_9BACT|nr:iron complex outermembrane recepter protein [Desulfobacula phenolica]
MVVMVAVILGASCINAHGEFYKTQDHNRKLESITVTARKTEASVREVPVSVDVFSDIMIQDAGIKNVHDLTKFSPNVHIKQNYTDHVIVIRGIPSFRASTHSPAGLYVDDICYPLHYMQNTTLFDVERAEILKGPQGTLYGRNTESGVINIVTRQPGNQFQGKVYGDYGSDNTLGSGANISGPLITNKLFMGAAVKYTNSDGYFVNLSDNNDQVADSEQTNARTTLRWKPMGQWDISVTTDYIDADNHIGAYRLVNGPHATKPFEVRKDEDEYYEEGGNSQVLRIKHKGDAIDFLSVSGALYQTIDRLADNDLWDDPANRMKNRLQIKERQYSQEFRLFSSQNDKFEWLAGFYGFLEKSDFNYKYDIVSKAITVKNPITDIDTSGYAFFGQGTYSLFDKLHLTAGFRYDHQDQEGTLIDPARDSHCSQDLSYDEYLPKFALAYDLSGAVMIYTSASKGYLAGGYNWLMNPVTETFSYGPEYTWNYELGLKAEWLEGKLMANFSFFHTDIEDKQVTQFDTSTLLNSITNAAKARSRGLELELKTTPIQGLDIFAGLGYTDSRFIEGDHKDNHLPYAPEYSYNAGIQYRSQEGFFCRADLMGADAYYGDIANRSSQKAYKTVNLRLGYERESFDIYIWTDNLFDEEYLTYVSPFDEQSDVGLDASPRTVGINCVYRF